MGIKKIARPMNKAKNAFVDWLKKNDARITGDYSDDRSFDYYFSITAFVSDDFILAKFMVFEGEELIDLKYGKDKYIEISIDKFMDIIK